MFWKAKKKKTPKKLLQDKSFTFKPLNISKYMKYFFFLQLQCNTHKSDFMKKKFTQICFLMLKKMGVYSF